MTDSWTDKLSEYLDGELERADAGALERHLSTCANCRTALDELRAVAATARALDDREPETELWSGIAARIRAAHTGETAVVDLAERRSRRHVSFTIPQLAAAAAAVLMVGVSATVLTMRDSGSAPVAAASPTVATEFLPVGMLAGGAEYESAIQELAEALEKHRDALDSTTVFVLEQSLAVIESAIVEAQEALRQEPDDQYLNAHVAHAKQRKLELLTRAVNIATASS